MFGPLPRSFPARSGMFENLYMMHHFMCLATRPTSCLIMPTGKEVLDEALSIAKEVMSPEEFEVTKVEFGITND